MGWTTFNGTGTTNASSGSSQAINMSSGGISGVLTGDLVVVTSAWAGGDTTCTITTTGIGDPSVTELTPTHQVNASGRSITLHAFVAAADQPVLSSAFINQSLGANRTNRTLGWFMARTGAAALATTYFNGVAAGNTGNTANASIGPITPAWHGALIVAAICDNAGFSYAPGAGFTEAHEQGSVSKYEIEFLAQRKASPISATWTHSATDWAAQMVAIMPEPTVRAAWNE